MNIIKLQQTSTSFTFQWLFIKCRGSQRHQQINSYSLETSHKPEYFSETDRNFTKPSTSFLSLNILQREFRSLQMFESFNSFNVSNHREGGDIEKHNNAVKTFEGAHCLVSSNFTSTQWRDNYAKHVDKEVEPQQEGFLLIFFCPENKKLNRAHI